MNATKKHKKQRNTSGIFKLLVFFFCVSCASLRLLFRKRRDVKDVNRLRDRQYEETPALLTKPFLKARSGALGEPSHFTLFLDFSSVLFVPFSGVTCLQSMRFAIIRPCYDSSF